MQARVVVVVPESAAVPRCTSAASPLCTTYAAPSVFSLRTERRRCSVSCQRGHWKLTTSFSGLSWGLDRLGARLRQHSDASLRVFALKRTADTSVKWILESVGDGICDHLTEEVPLPRSFELLSDSTKVGRVAEKADVVLSVATVSGLHARLEKIKNALYITDLDSTNGTYINGKRLRPGIVTPVPPGSLLTFGDEHLAVFRYWQVEEQVQSKREISEG